MAYKTDTAGKNLHNLGIWTCSGAQAACSATRDDLPALPSHCPEATAAEAEWESIGPRERLRAGPRSSSCVHDGGSNYVIKIDTRAKDK